MSTDQRIKTLTSGLEEVLTPSDLTHVMELNIPLHHYIGFEISGTPHIGSVIKTMHHIRNFQEAKVDCEIFLADWHTWINDKLGGDKEVIQSIARGYFTDCFMAGALIMNTDVSKIKWVLGSELYHEQDGYWETVIDVAKHTSLARMQRSVTILGRQEGENLDFAKLIYPAMQVADVYFQRVTLAHAGMDQRKAHVVMREVAKKLQYHPLTHNGETLTPIALHHHLVMGLQKPPMWPIPKDKIGEMRSALKMSKSVQGSAVFLDDSPEEIKKKMNAAFCVEKNIEYNPVLNWAEHIVFPFIKEMKIERPAKFGGNVSYSDYATLSNDFAKGDLHPMDLKAGMTASLSEVLFPARKYLSKDKVQQHKKEFERLKLTR
ncbi:MAG: tyrosine--tRNA ligase [Candidatus Diapherotrites archaeon]